MIDVKEPSYNPCWLIFWQMNYDGREKNLMFKIGDKFIIVVDSVMTNHKGVLYGIKGFKSLVFDNYGLEQLEKANKPCSESVEVWKEKYKKALMDNNELTRENSELKKKILEISILLGTLKML